MYAIILTIPALVPYYPHEETASRCSGKVRRLTVNHKRPRPLCALNLGHVEPRRNDRGGTDDPDDGCGAESEK